MFFNKEKAIACHRSVDLIGEIAQNSGVNSSGRSEIFISRNGSPSDNTRKVLEMMGGMEGIIGPNDVVILKPNGQWWNQGMTHTEAMKAFIEMVLAMRGFKGELIIAENHHFPEDNSRGWTTSERNGPFNYNELIEFFQKEGYKNVTKYHWHDGGPSVQPSWGGAENGGVVDGPGDTDGYVWCTDLEYKAPTGRRTLMSYPVFTSRYSGLQIDLKRGVWNDRSYSRTPLKFINFSPLNHHGQTGVTASIKNLLGVVDMTCGNRGLKPEGYDNFHFVGFSNLPRKLRYILEYLGKTFTGEYIGGAVGRFMKTVRMPDLNIITADSVGWGGRVDLTKSAKTRCILASRDPVALDYYASKYVLLPATMSANAHRKYLRMNDPDNKKGPFFKFLRACHAEGVGTLNEDHMFVMEFDCSKDGLGVENRKKVA